MLPFLSLLACNTDLNELLEALEDQSSSDDDRDSDGDNDADPAETQDDMGNELDGWPVGTDSDRVAILLAGEAFSGTRVSVVPVEGGVEAEVSTLSLTMAIPGSLSIPAVCCDANGEDLSLELLPYRLTGNATGEVDTAGDLVIDGLRDASRDGLRVMPEPEAFSALAAVPSALSVDSQPSLRFGAELEAEDSDPTSIIGIVIESDATPESYVVGGLEILDDKVFSTGLGDAGFEACRVEVYDGGELLHASEEPCDEVEFPVWVVPAEGELSAGLEFSVDATEGAERGPRFSLSVVSAREAGSGMATGR